MPTGYTSFIEEGKVKTGKEFIKLCARNFGAYIDARDLPLSEKVPDKYEPDNYYTKCLQEAIDELTMLQNMSEDEYCKECTDEYGRKIYETKVLIEKEKIKNANYKKILNEVHMWNPPTEEHERLKTFAIEQINISMDNNIQYYEEILATEMQSPEEWYKEKLKNKKRDIQYYTNKLIEEKERIDKRNKWIKQLNESLNTKYEK